MEANWFKEQKPTQSDSCKAAGNLPSFRHTAEPPLTRKVLKEPFCPPLWIAWFLLCFILDIVSVHLILFKHWVCILIHLPEAKMASSTSSHWILCKSTECLYCNHLGSVKKKKKDFYASNRFWASRSGVLESTCWDFPPAGIPRPVYNHKRKQVSEWWSRWTRP